MLHGSLVLFPEVSWPQLTNILNRMSGDDLWNLLQSKQELCWPKISVQRCNDAAIIMCAFLRLQRAKSIRVRLPHGKKHKTITDLEKELQIACVAESVLREWSQFQRSEQHIVSFRDVAQNCADDLTLYARLVLDSLPGPTAARLRMRQWLHFDDYEDEMKRLIGWQYSSVRTLSMKASDRRQDWVACDLGLPIAKAPLHAYEGFNLQESMNIMCQRFPDGLPAQDHTRNESGYIEYDGSWKHRYASLRPCLQMKS